MSSYGVTSTFHLCKRLIEDEDIEYKKFDNGITIRQHGDRSLILHSCPEAKESSNWGIVMCFRENEDGPMYWCPECGYTLANGEAMAIRLYEVNL